MSISKNINGATVIMVSRKLPLVEIPGANVVFNDNHYRTMGRDELTEMVAGAERQLVASGLTGHFVVTLSPRWWEDYVRLQKVVALLTELVGEVDLAYAFGAAGQTHLFRVALPSREGRFAVMMSVDAMMGAFLEKIDFVGEFDPPQGGPLDPVGPDPVDWTKGDGTPDGGQSDQMVAKDAATLPDDYVI